MTYLSVLFELLQSDDFYVTSKRVEIAKGKNQYPYTWRKVWERLKREYKWQLRKLL